MTPPNDPRFSRPQPVAHAGYPQHQQEQYGTVVMSRPPQAAPYAQFHQQHHAPQPHRSYGSPPSHALLSQAAPHGPSGMPSALAFGFGVVAVVVALVFDVIFLNVHVPGVGGYAWYLSTALSFAAAGFAGAKFTKATRSVALAAIGVAAGLYGIADLGLGIALEHMPMGDALFLGIQGVAIAIFTGSGGVVKGLRAKG